MPAMRIGTPPFAWINQGCLSPLSPVHSYQPSAGTRMRRLNSGFQKGEPFNTVSSRALLAGPRLYQAVRQAAHAVCLVLADRALIGFGDEDDGVVGGLQRQIGRAHF